MHFLTDTASRRRERTLSGVSPAGGVQHLLIDLDTGTFRNHHSAHSDGAAIIAAAKRGVVAIGGDARLACVEISPSGSHLVWDENGFSEPHLPCIADAIHTFHHAA